MLPDRGRRGSSDARYRLLARGAGAPRRSGIGSTSRARAAPQSEPQAREAYGRAVAAADV